MKGKEQGARSKGAVRKQIKFEMNME